MAVGPVSHQVERPRYVDRLSKFMRQVAKGVDDNADILLTGAALLGLITTVVLVIKETPAAMDILDESNESINRIDTMERAHDISPEDAAYRRKEIKIDTAKKLAINYAPAGVSVLLTGGCMVGSTGYSRSKTATLTGLLNASNLAFTEYRDHVREAIGEKKETAIHDIVRREHIESKDPPIQKDVYDTGDGNVMCYLETYPGDPSTGIYFLSSPEAVHKAINDANAEGIESGYVSMADLLYFMHLRLPGGGTRFYGWQISGRSDLIQTREGSHIHEKTGKPVLDISFYNPPYQGFDRFG